MGAVNESLVNEKGVEIMVAFGEIVKAVVVKKEFEGLNQLARETQN